MRKERSLLRRNRKDYRVVISEIINSLDIAAADFRPLSVHENWQQIEANIYHTFCSISHPGYKPVPLWNHFKLYSYTTFSMPRPEQYLDQLIDESEMVWFMVDEVVREKNKFWLYEGKIKTIQSVIDETYFRRFHIISKKYEWMLCISAYDHLIATGNNMPDKLRQLFPENQ